MSKNWRRGYSFVVAMILLLLPILNASGGQAILSQEEYDEQFQVYLETYVATPELVSTWEYSLREYPENNQLRYYLGTAYMNSGQFDKAKACALEALQYEPDSSYFAYVYLMLCFQSDDLHETQDAAEHLLDIVLPLLPPAGQPVDQHAFDNNYTYLKYYMNAVYIMQAIYSERGNEEEMLQYSDWILQRKSDSDLGYKYGLLSMFYLAVHYARADRFNDMEYWMEQYFAFEATANNKDEAWKQQQELLQPFTDILQKIDNAYLEQGNEIDIYSFFESDASQ
ncbi:MAG TPA: tetratricopeptide repeat protein [Candidatus Limiplasma sp.]|nr:tetratricopeptide repeat protein [Candidatus Limiplasma sp.]